MRTRRVVLLALGMLLVNSAPASALSVIGGVSFTMSPVGGTPGTTIFVDGTCAGANDGWAYLEVPPTSDALLPPADTEHFTVSNGRFNATLQSPYGSREGGFPTDARVRVTCGFFSASRPFHASNSSTGFTPSIFTSLGATPCGFSYAPPGSDSRIPCPAHVKGFSGNGALAQTNFYPNPLNSHGRSIAVGDVTGDGRLDIVTGAGQGEIGEFVVESPTGEFIASAGVYGGFTGGVNVAVGDVTGDGRNDVVTGAGPGGGPHVLVLTYNAGTQSFDTVGSFFAYDSRFGGGVNVAVGAGHEIITGAGPGGGPNVRRFDSAGRMRWEFMAYDPRFAGGVSVAYVWRNGSIVTGAGAGGGPHVAVFDVAGAPRAGFYAYDPSFTGGVNVAAGRVDGNEQLVTGAGPGGMPHVRIFNTDGTLRNGGFYAYGPFTAGVKVAAAP